MCADRRLKKSAKKIDENIFPTNSHGNIIPGTYQTNVGEVRIKPLNIPENKDVISLSRCFNSDFAAKTKEIFSPEVEACHEALRTGFYISWRPIDKSWNKQDCQRVPLNSRCFCDHLLNKHESFTGKNINLKCKQDGCTCTSFRFIPSRPEQIGEVWLLKRPDFDLKTYRVKCKCKHTHDNHAPYPMSYRCQVTNCGCMAFHSAFLCAACDKHWHEHETVFETEAERRAAGRPVGEAWIPFAELPELSKIVVTGIDNPAIQSLDDVLGQTNKQQNLNHDQKKQLPSSQNSKNEN